MKPILKRVIEDQGGQDLVEYALLAAIVAMGSVVALSAFRTVLTTAWAAISAMLSN
jgi:pilus assembly protein Flp/PilA